MDFSFILIKLHTNFVYSNPSAYSNSGSVKTRQYSIYTL